MIKALFVVSSPLQLLNAVEAKHYFRIENADAYLMLLYPKEDETYTQTESLLKLNEWADIFRFITWQYKIFSYYSTILALKKIDNKLTFNRIFLGDYNYDLMRHVGNLHQVKDIVALDDGAATIGLALHRGSESRVKTYNVKSLIKYLLGIRCSAFKRLSFFTCYDLELAESSTIYKNEYPVLRKNICGKKIENVCLVVGTPLVDDYLSLDEYAKILEKINACILKNYKDCKVIYIPHRREKNCLNKEVLKLSWEWRELGYPIELFPQYNPMPTAVLGLFSSALITYEKIFKECIDVFSFRPENKSPLWSRLPNLIPTYNYFALSANKNPNFKLIELDEV